MNRIHLRLLGKLNDLWNVQIGGNGRRSRMASLGELEALVGAPSMLRELVFFDVNGRSGNVKLCGRSHDSNRDLGSIGGQYIVERRHITLILDRAGRVGSRCLIGSCSG
jgi:hypothetical protein